MLTDETNTTSRSAQTRRRRRTRVSDDACPICGTITTPRTGPLPHVVNGESIVVPDIRHLHCGKCGESMLDPEAMDRLWEGAEAIYRERHGLLSGAEILAIRERLGLTQAELAVLIRVGANTLSRWETGRNVQSAAMDLLLRLLKDVPGTLAHLRTRAA